MRSPKKHIRHRLSTGKLCSWATCGRSIGDTKNLYHPEIARGMIKLNGLEGWCGSCLHKADYKKWGHGKSRSKRLERVIKAIVHRIRHGEKLGDLLAIAEGTD